MTDDIELRSFCVGGTTNNYNDIEEYHEINQEIVADRTISKNSTNDVNDYDFFTAYDVTPSKKSKRKKSTKKGKSSGLLDIINTELASTTIPLTKNVINIDKFTVDHKEKINYMQFIPLLKNIFLKLHYRHGNGRRDNTVVINPTFPKIIDIANVRGDHYIPIQYVEPEKFNNLITNYASNNVKQETTFLDVTIKNIRFIHHHNFSLEKLVSIKLVDSYNEYVIIQKTLEEIKRDMKVSRETRDNLKKEFLRISSSNDKKKDIRFDETLRKYTKKLLQMKEKYTNMLLREKEITHAVVCLWSDILVIRDNCALTKTPYIVEIKKNELSQTDLEKEWLEVFNLEFNDMLDKIEYDYVTQYIKYKELKNEQEMSSLEKKSLRKPRLEINEDALKEEVETIVNNIINAEKVFIYLKEDQDIISDDYKSTKKQKYKYYFNVYVDDAFVCESEECYVKENEFFEIDFKESFSVQILPNNKILLITLCENDDEVACIKKYLRDISKNNEDFVIENFVYNNIVEPNSNTIGSGHSIKEIASQNKIRLKSVNAFKGNLYTTCKVNVKIGWNHNINQNESEAIKSSFEVGRRLKRLVNGIDKPILNLLTDAITDIYDKNVSDDEDIIRKLRNMCKTDLSDEVEFQIDENDTECIRLKLLHLRNNGGFHDIDNKSIPLLASQISTEQLNCLQKSKESGFDIPQYKGKYKEMDHIELKRFMGVKYVQKLNRNMLKNLNEHLLRKTHKDVVRDFKDLSLRGLFSSHRNLATLAANSSYTRNEQLMESLSKQQEIRVKICRAFNLVDRTTLLNADSDVEKIAGMGLRRLRPWIRVSYAKANARTAPAVGCHPTFNHTLIISTRLEPLSSIYIDLYDEHKLNITDEDGEDDGDESFHGKTIRYRQSNKWLGTLQVPIYTVLSMGTLQGTFKLSAPPLLLGYENHTKETTSSVIPEIVELLRKEISFISLQISTSLSHLGGLQCYDQPAPNNSEDDYLIKHLNTFVTDYINEFPNRNISLTFIDSCGRNKCVTQFLQPIILPDVECFPKNSKKRSESAKSSSSRDSRRKDDMEKASPMNSGEERESIYSTYEGHWKSGDNELLNLINACLRYVSLIPTYEVTETHSVTLLGMELLKVLYGSPLDHTILLASYFLYLGIRCYVAIGVGLPRGASSYVLTKYDQVAHKMVMVNDEIRNRGLLNKNTVVWQVHDAVSGESFPLRDVSCPLKSVHYVFDNENIWVNVQSSQECENMSFDLLKSSNWKQVFDKSIFVISNPIINDASFYSAPPDAESLKQTLENKLKAKIQKWRPHMKTIWNRYCSSLVRETLPHWEYWSFHPASPRPGFGQRLKQIMATYRLFGFPLNMSYVNTKAVSARVKATAIHATAEPSVEFALAVEVYPYPGDVISVWVFLASIVRI